MDKRIRIRGLDVRSFILGHVAKHPNDIAKITAHHFSITRQAVSKHIRRLVHDNLLTEAGETRKRTYKLTLILEWRKDYKISPELEEYVLWDKDVAPTLGKLSQNVMDIWHYGFTEMLNNAKDHSEGTEIIVAITKTAIATTMQISDNGVGIFKKIQQALNLPDERYSVLELAKGKLTTDPKHHSGEGVFFSSRMFDEFAIGAENVYFSHSSDDESDWIFQSNFHGTNVFMEINNSSHRNSKDVFDKYAASEEDFGFNKTVVPIRLAQYGNDKLISRSQAKRVVGRLEVFKTVLFDFKGVPTIGQAFADEIFRVFANEHPNISVYPANANSEVLRMIERVKSAPIPSTPQVSPTP